MPDPGSPDSLAPAEAAPPPAPVRSRGADLALAAMVLAAVVASAVAVAAELAGRGAPQARKALERAASFPITLAEIRKKNLSLREARYWKPMGDGRAKCGLCPFECEIAEGERGACKARANIEGKLRCLTYGRVVAAHDDPIEKKPLFHFLPGAQALSIATIGCNLGCVFCQNWEISQSFPEERTYEEEVPPERIVDIARERGIATIAFTYTEPTVFYEYMLDIARGARKAGIRTLWITCGYINPGPLEEFCEVLDAANVDLKGYDEAFYRKYCKATLPPVLRTLETLRRKGIWVEVTNLVIPGANDDPDGIRRMCSWMRRTLGEEIPLHFSRFHPDYLLKDRPATPPSTLERARSIAREEGLKHVYIGNLSTSDGETTFCPKCARAVVVREGFWVKESRLEGGRCGFCGAPVAGVWK
jgi:pyruvate formate lyase activating enzyme